MNDAVPETLSPLIQAIANDFFPVIEATLVKTIEIAATLPDGKILPRSIADITVPKAEGQFTCNAPPFVLWKMQRVQNIFKAMSETDQQAVRAWLTGFNAEGVVDLKFPRMQRIGLRVKFAKA